MEDEDNLGGQMIHIVEDDEEDEILDVNFDLLDQE